MPEVEKNYLRVLARDVEEKNNNKLKEEKANACKERNDLGVALFYNCLTLHIMYKNKV
jgi:hypothetical protein